MTKPHYVVRRSRNGRFNFTFIFGYDRLKGCVVISTAGKSDEQIWQEATSKIREVANEFLSGSEQARHSPIASDIDGKGIIPMAKLTC